MAGKPSFEEALSKRKPANETPKGPKREQGRDLDAQTLTDGHQASSLDIEDRLDPAVSTELAILRSSDCQRR